MHPRLTLVSRLLFVALLAPTLALGQTLKPNLFLDASNLPAAQKATFRNNIGLGTTSNPTFDGLTVTDISVAGDANIGAALTVDEYMTIGSATTLSDSGAANFGNGAFTIATDGTLATSGGFEVQNGGEVFAPYGQFGALASEDTAAGPGLLLVKANSGTASQDGRTIEFRNVQGVASRAAGTAAGSINWSFSRPDTGALVQSAFVRAITPTTQTGSNTQTAIVFGTTQASGAATEKMRLGTSGGLSIGNTFDPGAGNLFVNGTAEIGGNLAMGGNLVAEGSLTATAEITSGDNIYSPALTIGIGGVGDSSLTFAPGTSSGDGALTFFADAEDAEPALKVGDWGSVVKGDAGEGISHIAGHLASESWIAGSSVRLAANSGVAQVTGPIVDIESHYGLVSITAASNAIITSGSTIEAVAPDGVYFKNSATDSTRNYIFGNDFVMEGLFGAGTLVIDGSGIVSTTSDPRLKHIQGRYDGGLDRLMRLSPDTTIKYRWRADAPDGSKHDTVGVYTGFDAALLKEAIPEAVRADKDGWLSIDDRPVLATLVNAVREQQAQIARLQLLVAALAGGFGVLLILLFILKTKKP